MITWEDFSARNNLLTDEIELSFFGRIICLKLQLGKWDQKWLKSVEKWCKIAQNFRQRILLLKSIRLKFVFIRIKAVKGVQFFFEVPIFLSGIFYQPNLSVFLHLLINNSDTKSEAFFMCEHDEFCCKLHLLLEIMWES